VRITVRGALVMLLCFGTAITYLMRVFVDVSGVDAIMGRRAPILEGSGRFLLVAVLIVAAGVAALLRAELGGLGGGLAVTAVGLYGSWLGASRTELTGPMLLGIVATSMALGAYTLGAVWRSPAARTVGTGVRVAGVLLTVLVFVGQFLPVHGAVFFGDLTTVLVLMATFAVGQRSGLWAAIGVSVGRLVFPLYYLVLSPRRNPFTATTHPVLFLALVLVILASIVGLAGSPAEAPERA
jgi:hypothetical protein